MSKPLEQITANELAGLHIDIDTKLRKGSLGYDQLRWFVNLSYEKREELIGKKKESAVETPAPKLWKTLTIGGKTANELIKEIKKNFRMSDYAESIMKHKNFTTLNEQQELGIAKVTLRELGFTKSPTFSEWIAFLKSHAIYDICPAEVGPHARLAYPEQTKGEWIRTAMETIPDSGGYPSVFRVGHYGDAPWLYGYYCNADDELDLDNLWFVSIRK